MLDSLVNRQRSFKPNVAGRSFNLEMRVQELDVSHVVGSKNVAISCTRNPKKLRGNPLFHIQTHYF